MIVMTMLRSRLGALGHRDFALFLGGTTLSCVGSATVPVALSFALFARGAGAGQVSAVLAAEAAPMVLLILLGGVLADRFAPRRIMVAADLLRAAAQSVLAILLLTSPVPLVAVLALAALVGVGAALDAPGRNRLLTQIVTPDRLTSANGTLMLATSTAGLLGPALGGVLVGGVGAGWAILLDAVTYLASALLLLCLRPRVVAPDPEAEPGLLRSLREGWDEFVRRTWVWPMVCLFAMLHLVSWAPTVVLGALLFAHRPAGALHWGMLLSSMGGGAIVGAALALRLRPVRPIRAVLLWLLAYPLVPISLAAGFPFWVQGLCFLLSGIEIANVNVLWESTLQRVIPPERLSRVSAYDQFGSFCLLPVGYALAGPMALLLGVTGALWLGAALVLLSTLTLLSRRDIRDAEVLVA